MGKKPSRSYAIFLDPAFAGGVLEQLHCKEPHMQDKLPGFANELSVDRRFYLLQHCAITADDIGR